MTDLIACYKEEELCERALGRIEATVLEARLNPKIAIREFGGNAYELTINFEEQIAIVADLLGGEPSTNSMPLEEFLVRIGASSHVTTPNK